MECKSNFLLFPSFTAFCYWIENGVIGIEASPESASLSGSCTDDWSRGVVQLLGIKPTNTRPIRECAMLLRNTGLNEIQKWHSPKGKNIPARQFAHELWKLRQAMVPAKRTEIAGSELFSFLTTFAPSNHRSLDEVVEYMRTYGFDRQFKASDVIIQREVPLFIMAMDLAELITTVVEKSDANLLPEQSLPYVLQLEEVPYLEAAGDS